MLTREAKNFARKAIDLAHGREIVQGDEVEEFWALKDVSFQVEKGEVLGIIGRNGAGKSTLLKILSRITDPTEGRVRVGGRMASLLEVGTGFHPELTGRENIFLNGAILGMKRSEILEGFDDIVAFAEIEKFLDTPVKRYSSGMYVRLAFAVAAHLEPEILVVDEVLAVGDVQFQKKCLGKMQEVADQKGRTVLFVSHNIGMISTLCTRTMLLQDGEVIGVGKTAPIVSTYLSSYQTGARIRASFRIDPSKVAFLQEASIQVAGNVHATSFTVQDELDIRVSYELTQDTRGLNLALCVMRNGSPLLLSFDTDLSPDLQDLRKKGVYEAKARLPRILKAGRYSINVDLGIIGMGVIDKREDALMFEIEELGVDFSQKSYEASRAGEIMVPIPWTTTKQ
jgi:lipopolysaccharide transport system ATP-binding protein